VSRIQGFENHCGFQAPQSDGGLARRVQAAGLTNQQGLEKLLRQDFKLTHPAVVA
jgi:hypothetical protein